MVITAYTYYFTTAAINVYIYYIHDNNVMMLVRVGSTAPIRLSTEIWTIFRILSSSTVLAYFGRATSVRFTHFLIN